jgi:error-prone DNA polymerase
MELLRDGLEAQGVLDSQALEAQPVGAAVRVAGLVAIHQMPATAKGFVFFTLEDENGLINVVVRPDIYREQRLVWSTARILLVEGWIERNQNQINVMARRAWSLEGPCPAS